jgi:hypothetical protein
MFPDQHNQDPQSVDSLRFLACAPGALRPTIDCRAGPWRVFPAVQLHPVPPRGTYGMPLSGLWSMNASICELFRHVPSQGALYSSGSPRRSGKYGECRTNVSRSPRQRSRILIDVTPEILTLTNTCSHSMLSFMPLMKDRNIHSSTSLLEAGCPRAGAEKALFWLYICHIYQKTSG